MKLLSILLLAATGTAAATDMASMADIGDMAFSAKAQDGLGMGKHSGGKNSTAAMCRRMFKLEKLEALAANATALDMLTRGNATKADEIRAEAEKEKPALAALMANSTLTATCPQIRAVWREVADCGRMLRLEKLARLVANATALDTLTKGNATKAAELRAKSETEKPALAALQGNATLTQFCSVQRDVATCRWMRKAEKRVKNAANETFLTTHFNGNTTKMDRYKAKAAKAEAVLKTAQANSTLTTFCESRRSGDGNGNANGGGIPTAAAPSLEAFGVSASVLALVAAGLLAL